LSAGHETAATVRPLATVQGHDGRADETHATRQGTSPQGGYGSSSAPFLPELRQTRAGALRSARARGNCSRQPCHVRREGVGRGRRLAQCKARDPDGLKGRCPFLVLTFRLRVSRVADVASPHRFCPSRGETSTRPLGACHHPPVPAGRSGGGHVSLCLRDGDRGGGRGDAPVRTQPREGVRFVPSSARA
jgi:hypothetical protein